MKIKRILIIIVTVVFLGSCVNYLEPYPQGNYDSEMIWEYQALVQGLIGYCYDQVNSNVRNYTGNEDIYMDGATDDGVITNSTQVMRRYAQNTMTTSQDPFATYWDRDYRAIRNCNLFLKDRRGYNTKYILNTKWNDLVRNRLQGEAFALRAWFQWDLLQKFGGMSGGVMLGFPIVTEVYDATDQVNLPRNTYEQCVAQIIADCDSAIKYLPIAHRDFLVPNSADRVYAGGKYWGRFDGISMKALKAIVYLTWASPMFNPGNDMARYDSAAVNAKKVIDFKLTVDNVASQSASFRPTNPVQWTNPNAPEAVAITRYNSSNDAIERLLYPGGFQGNGQIGASQELVDAFPMANGRPITDPLSGYDPANPYANRDPRFYSVIFYNNRPVYKNNTPTTPANTMYTFQNWNSGPAGPGKDAYGESPNNSLTNYHIKKFIFAGLNWSDASINRQPHYRYLIRWSEMLLAFAEAANQVVGPTDATKYGISAQTAIQYLRARKTYDNANGISAAVPGAPDAYLAEVAGAGKAAFETLVKNERRIELCFEGVRFYDLRRWATPSTWESAINGPVHGVTITQNEDLTFTYDFSYVADTRAFPSPWNPIPYSEILRMSNLQQNDGWDSWN